MDRAALVLVADLSVSARGADDELAAFLDNVHAAFGEFVSAFVSTVSGQTSVLDVSVIAAKEGVATVVCDRAKLSNIQTSVEHLAAIHSGLDRLRASTRHPPPGAQTACATSPFVPHLLDLRVLAVDVSPATVYVVSLRPYQATAAARVSLEKLQNALASVRFVAAQLCSAETLAATIADLHCCSSTVVQNDKESWLRLMRAELRDRKLLARSALNVSFPAGQTTHAVCLICDVMYMSQCELGQMQSLRATMFGNNVEAPGVVQVITAVKLSGVGDDLLLGGTSATLLASADSVHIDFDKMSTNADLFRAFLRLLKSSESGLVCYHESWQHELSCSTRRYFLLQPGERSFLMKRLATGDQLVPLPEDTFQNPIPKTLSDAARSSLAALPSSDVYNPCEYSTGIHRALTDFLLESRTDTQTVHRVRESSTRLHDDPIVSVDDCESGKDDFRTAHPFKQRRAPSSQSRELKFRRITNTSSVGGHNSSAPTKRH